MSEVADGPETNVIGPRSRPRLDARERLGQQLDDLRLADDADVEVGHERERAAPLLRAAGEDDRAGLGDRGRAAGECAVDAVELVRASSP